MASKNNNGKKDGGKSDEKPPISKETREDLRRMTQSLTDQATIEALSRAGAMAKIKREQGQSLREKRVEAGEKKEGEVEEGKSAGKDASKDGKGKNKNTKT
ncbi:hypothetical protein FBEOM_10451 [Fusarium beomiforme]|uniref:Uncharacterized protein n=1 Tax=Fusarium beomiforme TaxID=44412 RepID=A0A9P5AC96_9HYPO|nr:hypothetical protein FBEOM_10451 [Fusarium beomiforme]